MTCLLLVWIAHCKVHNDLGTMSDQGNIFLTYENLAFSMPLIAVVSIYVSANDPGGRVLGRWILALCESFVDSVCVPD